MLREQVHRPCAQLLIYLTSAVSEPLAVENGWPRAARSPPRSIDQGSEPIAAADQIAARVIRPV